MELHEWEDSLTQLEEHCGLPAGFCITLLHESDWAFVIKLHALFEKAVSQLLTTALGRNELSAVFLKMELSNTKTGKLAFVKALRLYPGEHVVFIRGLSELRNKLAHNVENAVNFDIIKYFGHERQLRSKKDARRLANQGLVSVTASTHRTQLPISAPHQIERGIRQP
jgi:hypothetical protein